MSAFNQPPGMEETGNFGYQGPQSRPSAMALLMSGVVGGAAVSVGSHMVSGRLRAMLGMQQQRAAGGAFTRRVSGFFAQHLGGIAGAQVGRAAGSALGMGLGGMFAGPPGAAVGGVMGGMYGGRYAYRAAGALSRHAVGGASLSNRVAAGAMRGLGVNANAARGIAAGVRGALVGGGVGLAVAGASMLGEAQPAGPAGDVANPQSIGLGMRESGIAWRRAQRERDQRWSGLGILGTLGRWGASSAEFVADTASSIVPFYNSPNQRMKMEARQEEMDGGVRVFAAQATQARMGNVGRSAVGGNYGPLGDRGSTDLFMMGVQRAHQVEMDARWEAERHRRRMEGGIL